MNPEPKVSFWGREQLFGWMSLFSSAVLFYLATLIIRWGESSVAIDASFYVFARFLTGFLVVSGTMLLRRQRLAPRNYHYLIGRAVANTVAVYCFYQAVAVGTVAEGNILNMTYPLFVALFSWFFLKSQRDFFSLGAMVVACTGIWLVLMPSGEHSFPLHNTWGVLSGLTAAAAILYLNVSRRCHDSQTILFFMFGIGGVIMYLLFRKAIFWPNMTEFCFLLACSAAGVLGQYLLTFGFRFVTALEGSIISSSRILFAAFLGPLVAADSALSWTGWVGAVLIFVANVGLAFHKKKDV